MDDVLWTYYEKELTFLHDMADEFAVKHPKMAGRLLLEQGKSKDPHIERMIQACALLAARVQLKIDDGFPQITESLLQILYPHYLAPVPSMSIVQFALDPERGKLTSGHLIKRDEVLTARDNRSAKCTFRTCYPTTLWPIKVAAVRTETGFVDGKGRRAPAAVLITLRSQTETRLPEMGLTTLRFYLHGEDAFVGRLYEALLGHCYQIEVRRPDATTNPAPLILPEGSLGEVGFGEAEGMLPYSRRSFLGYRLLQEYFQFPEKFCFVDVKNLDQLESTRFGNEVVLALFLDSAPRLLRPIQPEHLRLGCTPVVNLFKKSAEPISLNHAHTEYRVIPDNNRQRGYEVHSIEHVTSGAASTAAWTEYHPFYSFKHTAQRRQQQTFWHAARRPSEREDDAGTEVFLSLVDLQFRPTNPAVSTLLVDALCTNRDLPSQLSFMNERGDFDLDKPGPIKSATCLMMPTPSRRPPIGGGLQWRLISHLSLNYLSAVEGGPDNDPEILREIIKLYDFSPAESQESKAIQQQIDGLVGVKSQPVMRRVRGAYGSGVARGIEATLTFDEECFVGSSVYLFSSVLEKFLGLYVSINSFSEMVSVSKQRGEMKRWPLRSGQQVLL